MNQPGLAGQGEMPYGPAPVLQDGGAVFLAELGHLVPPLRENWYPQVDLMSVWGQTGSSDPAGDRQVSAVSLAIKHGQVRTE